MMDGVALILCEGSFGENHGKTAHGLVRFTTRYDVRGVIDSTLAGREAGEVLDLMKWVWEHRDYLGGITFLPAFDAMYDQMPYMEIDRAEYEKAAAHFPAIDFSKLYRYEEEDLTTAAQELACLAGVCDVDFAGKAPNA